MKTRKTSLTRPALAAAISLLGLGMSASAMAQDQTENRASDQVQRQDPIYGNQFMTRQELNEYQTKMRALKTEEERQAYRLEHHQKMQERAKVKGVTLPEAPPVQRPAMGADMGAGAGTGGGMGAGAGGGMGSGAGGKK